MLENDKKRVLQYFFWLSEKESDSKIKTMCNLIEIEGKIPMAVFRIGYADSSHHTPRRALEDFFIEDSEIFSE